VTATLRRVADISRSMTLQCVLDDDGVVCDVCVVSVDDVLSSDVVVSRRLTVASSWNKSESSSSGMCCRTKSASCVTYSALLPLTPLHDTTCNHTRKNKKFKLMLTRRAKAYSSSGSVV